MHLHLSPFLHLTETREKVKTRLKVKLKLNWKSKGETTVGEKINTSLEDWKEIAKNQILLIFLQTTTGDTPQ